MDPYTRLAELLKERENKLYPGAQTGTIVSVAPLEIRLNEFIVLNRNRLKLSRTFAEGPKNAGQKVILIPTGDMQQFYVVDVEV